MGVYEVIDCNVNAAVAVTNCDPRVRPGETAVLSNIQPLVPGQYYYLAIDGRNNDVCDWSIAVTNGTTMVPPVTQGGGIMGPSSTCSGVSTTYSTNTVPNAPNHYWYLDGTPLPGSGQTYDITFPGPGTYTVCVEASNTCSTAPQECMTVTVADIPPTTVNGVICSGQCFPFLTTQFCNPGTFSFNFTSSTGCDSLVTVVITQQNAVAVTLDTSACAGQSVLVRGNQYPAPGNYTVTLPGAGTCDTTLTLNVTEDPSFQEFETATICQGDSYILGTQVLTSSGSFSEVFSTSSGCDSVVNLTLNVQAPVTTSLVETVCFGGSFTVGTQTYTTTGTYTDLLQTSQGCDSTVNLDLTVLPQLMGTETAEICEGESYPFGGTMYGASGSYTSVFTSPAGCDSTVTLNLNVLPNSQTTLNEVICPGQSFPLGPNSYSTAGTYMVVFPSANTCDSTVTLNLSVQPSINVTENATICVGQSFPFDGQSLTTSGTYSGTFISSGGCDSVVTLNLTVAPNPVVNLVEIICGGDSYAVGPQTFTTTGNYTVLLTSAAGCDSTVNLDLTVQTAIMEQVTAEICDGDTYALGTQNYAIGGSYTQVLTSSAGCDSTVNLTLTVNPTYNETIIASICNGDSYTIGTSVFGATGFYTVPLQSQSGCDSIVNLDLTVVQTLTETVNATICPGDSYPFNGSSYSIAGSYPFQLASANGCDSIVTLELDVLQPVTESISASICQGDTYSVGTQNYTATGQYTTVLTSAAGCDSTVVLDLTVNQPQSVAITESICQGGRYVIDGQILTLPGSYNFNLQTTQGCDSMVALTLVVAQSYFETFSATICPGTSYSFAGQVFTSAGQYTTLLQTVAGCDSLLVLNLAEEQLIETNVSASICTGESYLFGGTTLTAPGSYNRLFTTAQGCDSLVLLELEVITAFDTQLSETICNGESVIFDGTPRTSTGTYTASLTSSGGCDSIVTLDLTVLPELTVDTLANLCFGESIQLGGQQFDETGLYTVSLVNSLGCDSIINLTLNVSGGDTTRLVEGICSGGFVDVGTQRFDQTGTYIIDLMTPTGCDSTVVLDLTVASQVLLSQSESLCAGQSVDVRGTTYSSPGTFTINAPGTGGECDTVITLVVQVGNLADSMFTAAICDGETYDFNGQMLTAAGTYTDALTAANGCDSTVTLDLIVAQSSTTTLSEAICAGDNFSFGGQSLIAAGTYQDTLVNAAGCDSLITLNLSVNPVADTTINASICNGATYEIGGQSFSASGTYTIDLMTATNCDSTITLVLNVDSQVTLTQNESLCAGQSVDVRGTTYDAPGTFTINAPGTGGECDTVITLTVQVGSLADTMLTAAICDGDTYDFNGQMLTVAGTYTEVLTAANGCDSTVTLDLAVGQTSMTTLSETICAGDSFTFAGQALTIAGAYQDVQTGASGCDSLITLNLSVNPVADTTINASICTGDTYDVGGQSFSASGTYTIDLMTAANCDSTITLVLNVDNEVTLTQNEFLCPGEDVTIRGTTYSSAGQFTISIPGTGNQCDTSLTLDIAVGTTSDTSITATICEGDSFPFDGRNLSTAGTYSANLTNGTGCDSTVNLMLTVLPATRDTTVAQICDGDSYTFDGRTFTASGNYSASFTSANGCDSLVTLALTVTPPLSSTTTQSICVGDSYMLGGQTFTASGTYSVGFTTTAGCDSTVMLDLSVVDSIVVDLNETICSGTSFSFGGSQLSTAGSYREILPSAAGCDSITRLQLTVLDTLTASISETICDGDSFVFAGSTLTDGGTYTDISTSSLGCDSATTLVLTVIPIDNETVDATICSGESFPFAGQVYSTAGSYSSTLINQAGCDSIVVLNLAVVDSIEVALTESICQGNTFNFGSQVLTTSGTYRDVSASAAGCDSITTLVLTVSDTVRSTTNAFICAGDTYAFDGMNLTIAGTYNQRGLTSSGGCDSVATLILEVGPIATSSIDTTVCTGDVVRIAGQQFSGAGSYDVTLIAANGCDSLLTLTITETGCSFNMELIAQDARCFGEATGSLLVTLDGAVAPVVITYVEAATGASESITLNTIPVGGYSFDNLPSGNYNVTVADAAGNSSSQVERVGQPAEPITGDLTMLDFNGYQISCDGAADGQAAVTVRGGTSPYTYMWSNGGTEPQTGRLPEGPIIVDVLDENGCPWSDNALLVAPEPLQPTLELTPISCDNPEIGGAIEIIGVDGGAPPFTGLINGQTFDPAGVSNLSAGSYLIEFSDANGCTAIPTTFDLEAAEEPKIDAGSDRTIVLGDTVRIDVLSSLLLDSIWFVNPLGFMSCTSCPDPLVAPVLTTDYLVRGITESGCEGEDVLRIIVRRDDVIFVPSAFSPNGDANNDQFTVFVKDENAIVEEFRVFDRWGEEVFVGVEFQPNIPELGWDGRLNGELMNPQVLVYWARVRFRDGRTQVVKGDFTLIR